MYRERYLGNGWENPRLRIFVTIKSGAKVYFAGEVIGGECSYERKSRVRWGGSETLEVRHLECC